MKSWLLISRECIDSSRRGGIASANYNHIQMLNENGISVVELVAKEPKVLNKVYNEKYTREALSFRDYSIENRFFKKLLRLFCYLPYRLNIMFYVLKNHNKFDVIEVADYGAEGIFLMFFPFLRRKVIVRGHTISSLDLLGKEKKIRIFSFQYILEIIQLLISKHVFCCSHSLANVYKSTLGLNSKVIYNPLKLLINPQKINDSSRNDYLFLGTISKAKGADIVLELIRKYNRRVTFAGRLSNEIQLDQSSSKLKYLGLVNKEMVNKLLLQHKVLIISSRWENLPMVIIEAMNSGILVVGANNSGISELISNGETGFLYNTESVDDLESTLIKVDNLSDEEYQLIAISAKKHITNLNSYDAVYKNWCEFKLKQ